MKEEKAQITVIVDGKQGINELGRLEMQAADLKNQMKESKKSFDDFSRSSGQLDKVSGNLSKLEKAAQDLRGKMDANKVAVEQFTRASAELSRTNTDIKNLSLQAKDFKTAMKGAKEGTAEYVQASNGLEGVKAKIAALRENATRLKTEMNESKKSVQDYDKAANGIEKVNAQISKLASKSKDLGSAMASAKTEAEKYTASKDGLKAVSAEIDKQREKIGITGMTMNQLVRYQKELNTAINSGTTFGTQKYGELKTKLTEVSGAIQKQKNDLKGVQDQSNATAGSIGALKLQEAKLNEEIKTLTINTKDFIAKARELRAVEAQIASAENKIKGFAGSWANMKSSMLSTAGGVIGGNLALSGFQKLMEAIPNFISAQSKLSDSLANIQKTTGMSATEVRNFNKQLSSINTRTSTEELRNIAIVAGQIGIAQKDIFAFTAAVDKMVVALGDEFTGGAEQITKEMGALRNIFSDIKTDNVAEDMLHIGNAVNQLGAEGAATGPVITDFASRIGGVGIQLGLTSGQILGMSATLQELNVTAERGGTAVVKILQRMAATPEEFAKVAKGVDGTNMSLKAFKDLVNNDIYGAFEAVIRGSNSSGDSATALAGILKKLDVDGAGASEVFAKLGGNMDLLTKKVASSNSALKSTDSIMNEFSIKNENLAAKLEKLGKVLMKAFTMGVLTNNLESIVNWLYKLIPATEKHSAVMERERVNVQATAMEIFSLNVGNEKRTKLINQLKESYPEYLGQIDADKVGNEELSRAIDKVNAGMIDRIVIQKLTEEVTAQMDIAAEKARIKLELENQARQDFVKFYEQGGRRVNDLLKLQNDLRKTALTTEQQYMIVVEEVNQSRISGISAANPYLERLAGSIRKVREAEIDYNGEIMKSIDLQKKRKDIMKILGIEEETNKPAKKKALKFDNTLDELSKKDKAEAERLAKERLEAERKIIEARLAAIKDEHERKKAMMREQTRQEIEDFKGTDKQKSAFSKAAKAKLERELNDLDREYYGKAREQYEQFEKQKKEAAEKAAEDAKKSRQKLMDEAITDAELKVLLVEKIENGEGFKNRSEQLIKELRIRRGMELANAELTEQERQAITEKYDKQIAAFRVANETSITDAKVALLELQMAKELDIAKETGQNTSLIMAKYMSEISDLRQEENEKEMQAAADRVEQYLQAVSTIIGTITELRVQAIDNEILELQRIKGIEDEQFERRKLQINELMQVEEAAKNARIDKAEQEKNKYIAHIQAQFKAKKITETEFNRLKEKAETDYAALKTAEDNKFTASKEANEKKLIAEKEKAEEAYRQKERALKLKQWEIEKSAKISQAIIEGAVGLVKAIASGDYLRAALVTITTSASIAKIDAQPTPAFFEGGSTGKPISAGGMATQPYLATVAEKGPEYIIPNWQLRTPAVANIVGMLETMRVNRSTTLPTQGSSIAASGTAQISTSSQASATEIYYPMILNKLEEINEGVKNFKQVKGVWDFNTFEEGYQQVKDTIKNGDV